MNIIKIDYKKLKYKHFQIKKNHFEDQFDQYLYQSRHISTPVNIFIYGIVKQSVLWYISLYKGLCNIQYFGKYLYIWDC